MMILMPLCNLVQGKECNYMETNNNNDDNSNHFLIFQDLRKACL